MSSGIAVLIFIVGLLCAAPTWAGIMAVGKAQETTDTAAQVGGRTVEKVAEGGGLLNPDKATFRDPDGNICDPETATVSCTQWQTAEGGEGVVVRFVAESWPVLLPVYVVLYLIMVMCLAVDQARG